MLLAASRRLSIVVAPFTGAWIEIKLDRYSKSRQHVAPFTGAWIEMEWPNDADVCTLSLPSRERGLK